MCWSCNKAVLGRLYEGEGTDNYCIINFVPVALVYRRKKINELTLHYAISFFQTWRPAICSPLLHTFRLWILLTSPSPCWGLYKCQQSFLAFPQSHIFEPYWVPKIITREKLTRRPIHCLLNIGCSIVCCLLQPFWGELYRGDSFLFVWMVE